MLGEKKEGGNEQECEAGVRCELCFGRNLPQTLHGCTGKNPAEPGTVGNGTALQAAGRTDIESVLLEYL